MQRQSRLSAGLALGILGLTLAMASPGRAEENITLPSRPGITEQALVTIVPNAPASIILLVGGNGLLDQVRRNFLLRVRGQFVQQGFTVAVPDAPSDHTSGMDRPFRESAEHAEDLAAVIAFVRSKSPGPVWLIGTSNGTISASNAAARLGRVGVGGIVMTSTVWLAGISDVRLEDIAVPTLVVHNRGDTCPASPFLGVEQGMARMTKVPVKELIAFSSNHIESKPCDAMSPHGYLGIEDQVVPAIVQWIKTHKPEA